MAQDRKKSPLDIWRFGYEWKTKTRVFGLPLIHVALGRDEKTGRLLVAKGVVAIGQFAVGVVSLGQFAVGVLAVAQLAAGLLFGLGQFATGATAIGQFAVGKYVLAQFGWGGHVWSMLINDNTALEYFKNFL